MTTSEKRPYTHPSIGIVRVLRQPVVPPPMWGWDCYDCGAFMRGLDSDQQARESSARHRREAHGDTTESGPACRHDWMERGGPDDAWRECFLCGEQRDKPSENGPSNQGENDG